jgi:hypothetical protein
VSALEWFKAYFGPAARDRVVKIAGKNQELYQLEGGVCTTCAAGDQRKI